MWDALFLVDIWIALFGFGVLAALGIWAGDGWIAGGIVCAFNAVVLSFYTWWLQYQLFCEYRPIGEHYK